MRAVILAVLMTVSLGLTASEGDEVIAIVDGTPVLESEVAPLIEKQLRDLHHAEYELKRDALDHYLFEKVQQRLADEEGVPVETLWAREVEAKAATPTDSQITTAMQQNRARLPADDDQARQLMTRFLRQRMVELRAEAWRDELLADTDYQVLLEPVRYPIPSLRGDGVMGASDAPVTIVEFSDFQCPYCAQSQEILQNLEKEYGDSVRIVFKHLPLDIHSEARLAAEASLCAQQQGHFRELHDWLFENPRRIQIETMREAAPGLGLDPDELEMCVQERRFTADVNEQMTQARDLGVSSTPTFFVNGRKVSDRSYEAFSRLIEEELRILQRTKASK